MADQFKPGPPPPPRSPKPVPGGRQPDSLRPARPTLTPPPRPIPARPPKKPVTIPPKPLTVSPGVSPQPVSASTPLARPTPAAVSVPRTLPPPPPSNKTVLAAEPPSPSTTAAAPDRTPADEDIIIRTMQDDLQASSTPPRTPTPTTTAPQTSIPRRPTDAIRPAITSTPPADVPPLGPTTTPSTPVSSTPSRTFPLPPKETTQQSTKVVVPPGATTKQGGRATRLILALAVIVVLFGAGGVGAWWLLQPQSGPTSLPPASAVAPALELLPVDAALILQYRLSSTDDRTDVLTAWQQGGSEPSVTGLLNGDPRLVLDDPDVNELYYVLLENQTRPYLIIPKTTGTETLLADSPDAHTLEQRGWYIAHFIDPEPYLEALESNSLAQVGGHSILDNQSSAPLRVIVGPGLLQPFRAAIVGEKLAAGDLQEVALTARFSAQPRLLEVAGTGVRLTPTAPGTVDQQLLSLVPASASLVRLGGNFSADLTAWQQHTGGLDDTLINDETTSPFLDQFSTPYALFIDTSAGRTNYGAIVELPATLRSTLARGNPTLEHALAALTPLLIGTATNLTFSDGVYATTPLRFSNLSNSPHAVDYAVSATHLLIATSKDTMFSLLNTVTDTAPSALESPTFRQVLTQWGTLPTSSEVIIGTTALPALLPLLPPGTPGSSVAIAVSLQASPDPDTVNIQGFLELAPGTPLSSPAPTTP